MVCSACNASQYCSGGEFFTCPPHSVSDPGGLPAVIEDCVCLPGYNRSSAAVCEKGQPPYWYAEGVQRLCPPHSRTTVTLADGAHWCVCEEGYEGPGGEAGACTQCAQGRFNEGVNVTRCEFCPPGSSHELTGSRNQSDCRCGVENEGNVGPPGGPCECDAGWEGGPGQCSLCEAGSVKPDRGNHECTRCDLEGKYMPGRGGTECLACGEHSTQHESLRCRCDAGYTGDPGALAPNCTMCAADFYKENRGQDPCEPCEDNAWSPPGTTAQHQCMCNVGYEQSSGILECVACAAGKYKNFSNDDSEGGLCTSCPSHADSPNTSTTRYACVCNVGYEGLNGEECSACAPGKFWTSVEGGSECQACAAGTYQEQSMATSCESCYAYSSSPNGSSSIEACTCNAGFSPITVDGSPACSGCEAGKYEIGGGCRVCAAGKFTAESAQTECQSCPARSTHNTNYIDGTNHTHCVCEMGYQCREGGSCQDGNCTACPTDTYQPELVDDPTCRLCPSNSQSPEASDAQHDCLCNHGYYATRYTCTACEAGKYSNELDVNECTICAMDSISAEAQAACVPCHANSNTYDDQRVVCTCDAGHYALNGSCAPCPVDRYKNVSGDQECSVCPPFSASPEGTVPREGCECLPGYGEDPPGSGTCVACAPDHFKETTSNEPCTSCGADLFVTARGSRNQSDCVCAPGSFLDEPACEQCTEDHYKPTFGNGSCTACKEHSASEAGSVWVEDCQCLPGYASLGPPNSTSATCEQCSRGYEKNNVSNTACSPCRADFYAYHTGQASCLECTGNSSTHGEEGRTLCDCVHGYERRWEDSAPCELCREGTFKTNVTNRNCTRCASCGSNEYVEDDFDVCSPFQDTVCTTCAENSWIEAGQQLPIPCFCRAGWESSPASTSARTECQACQPGTFRGEDRDNAVPCATCPPGSWTPHPNSLSCQAHSTHCQPQHPGTYVSGEGTATLDVSCSTCTTCPAGSYANRTCNVDYENNRADTQCAQCEEHYFCTGGEHKELCRNNAQSLPGSTAASDCGCRPGFHDLNGECVLCEVDHFCVAGVQRACPAHSISLHQGSVDILDCNCRHGFYRTDLTEFSFTCNVCTRDDWCFDNARYNCSDDRMVAEAGSSSASNCTCMSGWYNTAFNSSGSCVRCPADSYCHDGLRFSCPSDTWTNGLTLQFEPSACLCRPSLHKIDSGAGLPTCAVCPLDNYCPGDNHPRECHAHSETDGDGKERRQECLCLAGFEPGPENTSDTSDASCVPCRNETGYEQDGTWKGDRGNYQCQACTQCWVDPHKVFVGRFCSHLSDATCTPCDPCIRYGNTSDVNGLPPDLFLDYTKLQCVDRQDTTCATCTVCDWAQQYQARACSSEFNGNTVCESIDRSLACESGSYKGGHTRVEQSRCLPCQSRDQRLQAAAGLQPLHRFRTQGLRYDDPLSCLVSCLGNSVLRNVSDHSFGCVSCETGNVLLKSIGTVEDSTGNKVNCTFTCRPGYERSGDDCVLLPVRLSDVWTSPIFVELTAFQKTVDGFSFDVHHSDHGHFLVVVGPHAPTSCELRQCCWTGLWRVSTLLQMGQVEGRYADTCSAAPPLLAQKQGSSSLRFEVRERLLPTVTRCEAGLHGDVTCTLVLSVVDLVHWQVQSQEVRILSRRGSAQVLHLRGNHTYIALQDFQVDVAPLFRRPSGATVFLVLTRAESEASAPILNVHMRVRGMDGTELSAAERELCQRYTAEPSDERDNNDSNDSNDSNGSTAFVLTPGEPRVMRSYWVGTSALLHASYTLISARNSLDVMDIAAVRNISGQDEACQPEPDAAAVRLGLVRAGVGLGGHVASSLLTLTPEQPALSASGELGHLVTFLAEAIDSGVQRVALRGLLAVYVRGEAVDAMQQHWAANATLTVQGIQDFSPEFRAWCHALPDLCVLEYLARHRLYDSTKEVDCSDAAHAAEAVEWIRRSLGAVHDGGHVRALCQHVSDLQDHHLRSLPVLVHTMRFLDRRGPGWNSFRPSPHSVPSPPPTMTFLWPLFEFDVL